ncbi:hypothetical protein [Antrihabitans spumae]|uniref:DUF4352 domain-containing protein n=1 Tax=Antrihabitans spumae TaxID=3373370 RepID=A0ABW7KCL1_9NOCA
MTYPPPNGVPPHQPYPYGPPPGYPPTQYPYPPNQPPPSKGLGVGKVLLIIAAAVVGFIVFIGVLGAALGSDKDEPVVTNIGATPSVVEDKPADPPTDKAAPIAGTITYPDGLAARISGVTSGPSSNQFDSDGPLTLISFELRATKDKTLDAADWSPPYLNYGPGGTAAEHTIIAGDVNGISPADFSGTGLIQPGGVVTVTFAYEIPLEQLTSVTITPRWPGRMTWGGDLTTIPPSR